MSTFSDPNREAVGQPPIWTGAGDAGGGEVGPFDPGAHTVAEVEEYLEEHPDELEDVLERERSGKARVSLVGGDEE